MKKALRIILAVHLCIFLLICGVKFFYRQARAKDLLQHAEISDEIRMRQQDYTRWKDFLSYVNGYEVMAFRVDPARWVTPDGWICESTTVEEIESAIDFTVNEYALEDLNVDMPQAFDEWFFAEYGRDGEFADWQYYIGLYSDEGLLIIYRGHDLSSDMWMLFEDSVSDEELPPFFQ